MRGNDIFHVIPAVIQLARDGFRFAVYHLISLHAANGGYAREHACAIGVSQAALDVIMLELAGIDGICALHIFAQLGYVLG